LSDSASGRFDAFIVGAGPAGSHMAFLLASQGCRVAIIDKDRFPRQKVCGGGVSRKALDLLDTDLGSVVHRRIGGAFLTFANRQTLIKDVSPSVGVTVVRSEFDAFLLDRALAAGAILLPQTTFLAATDSAVGIDIDTDAGRHHSRLLFAADGAASSVRRHVFGSRIVGCAPALEALVPASPEKIESLADRAVFDFDVGGGYGWIFPKRDHLNVGVFAPYSQRPLRAELQRFMARYACLQTAAAPRRFGFPIPLRNLAGQYQRGRTWLLGDAAGLAESLFGEGIYFALKSATLAAAAIARDGFAADSRRYTDLLRGELLPELRAAARIARLIYRFPRFAFNHCVLNPQVNEDFAGLIDGSVGYRQCLRRNLLQPHRWLVPGRPSMAAASL